MVAEDQQGHEFAIGEPHPSPYTIAIMSFELHRNEKERIKVSA
jgi:hypothetical protein